MAKWSSLALRPRALWDARVYPWLDDRLGLGEILAFAKKKVVPKHRHTFWYYWGGLSLFLFGVQVVTGVFLLLYYTPGAEAYNSVRRITEEIEFGWLIRSVHSWSANLMVFCVFVHMFSVFFMRAYRNPREIGWWTGLGLLGVVMVFGFSGYLLPWDELAYFATKVGLDIPAAIPWVGEHLITPVLDTFVRGGPEVSETTNQRFFTLHVMVLPLVFAGLIGLHLYMILKHGNAVPPSEERIPPEKRETIPFFPNFMIKDFAAWTLAGAILVLLAAAFPWKLGPPADPLLPAPEGIHPEWYFMSQFQLLKALGNWFPGATGEMLGIGFFSLGGFIWALIPLLDNKRENTLRARVVLWFGLAALVGLIGLTVWGYAAL